MLVLENKTADGLTAIEGHPLEFIACFSLPTF